MNYDIYLFDADDTLFDFGKAEESALIETFKQYKLNYSEEIRIRYKCINIELWELFEKQEIDKSVLQTQRFSTLFQEIGVSCDIESFNENYIIELGRGSQLMDGAYDICKSLHNKGKELYVVTNGVSSIQKIRMESSSIKQFISGVFVSEDIGFQKPRKEFFDHVFSHIGEIDKRKILIIGDSLTSDIQGGINAGIDTCWFNPNKKENSIGIIPTYEIAELSEIYNLC